ncbi:MAG: acetate/propionate family kinase [Chloroflexota bacterium]
MVLNAGSSSLKWTVLDADTEATLTQGSTSWQGTEGGRHEAALRAVLSDLPHVDAVGHRVVQGGVRLREAVVLDDRNRQLIADLAELAPLHNPAALAGIEAAVAALPQVPQVAAFDTAFHATIPEPAALYPVPWEWTQRWGLRRFGFHGLSVQYAVRRTRELLGTLPRCLVVCHLGSGCSVTAVLEGRSANTSMGLTPMEGLMMARRSGSVDPGLLLYLVQHAGITLTDLERGLNEDSGLFGVSGVSADWRAVVAAATAGNPRAALARAMFLHRLVAAVGAMTATLGGLDALVFTGGIGENSAEVRQAVVDALSFAGVRLAVSTDPTGPDSGDRDLAASDSRARVLVLAAREDLTVLADVRRLVLSKGDSGCVRRGGQGGSFSAFGNRR